MESKIPPATLRSLDQWLQVISRRCELVTGESLDSLAMQIESSGRMTVDGLRLALAQKWLAGYAAGEPGCAAVRAARWILAEAALASDE